MVAMTILDDCNQPGVAGSVELPLLSSSLLQVLTAPDSVRRAHPVSTFMVLESKYSITSPGLILGFDVATIDLGL